MSPDSQADARDRQLFRDAVDRLSLELVSPDDLPRVGREGIDSPPDRGSALGDLFVVAQLFFWSSRCVTPAEPLRALPLADLLDSSLASVLATEVVEHGSSGRGQEPPLDGAGLALPPVVVALPGDVHAKEGLLHEVVHQLGRTDPPLKVPTDPGREPTKQRVEGPRVSSDISEHQSVHRVVMECSYCQRPAPSRPIGQ